MSEEKPQPPAESEWSLGRIGLEKATAVVALVTAAAAGLHTLFFGLGLLTYASREQLLGLSLPLSYPTQSALLTSLNVLWSVPLQSLWAPLSGEPWALAIFLPWLPLGLALRRMSPARRAMLAHLACLLLTVAALRLYQAALFPRLQPGNVAPHFSTVAGAAWTSQVEQHSVSWLTNEHPKHPGRRRALAGIAGWLVVGSAGAAWLASRRKRLRRSTRVGLAVTHLFLAVGALSLVPRAYSIAAWGLTYPRVHIREAPACDNALRLATKGRCCAFEVSAGGTPRTTLQLGMGCPGGDGFRIWSEEEARCFLLGAREVISDGCS